MNGETLLSTVKTAKTLIDFVVGGQLQQQLETYGKVEFDAAISSLKSATLAKDSNREIALTVGHLQSAKAAFQRQLDSTSRLSLVLSVDKFINSLTYGQYACLLLSICYCFLKEERLMVQQADGALECATFMEEKGLGLMAFTAVTAFNPRFIRDGWRDIIKNDKHQQIVGSNEIRIALSKMKSYVQG
jgi:hypothetical protein